MDDIILEPLEHYKSVARARHKENLTAHFDSLRDRAGVDEERNRETVKEHKAELAALDAVKGQITKWKVLRVLAIIAAVLLTPLLGLGIFLGIYWVKKKINPKLQQLENSRAAHEDKAAQLLEQAWQQMAPLNAAFRDDDTIRLMEKTVPAWKFNDHLSDAQLQEMIGEYDYVPATENDVSVVQVLSGTMCENPFLFERRHRMTMGTATYQGSLTIHWTERYTDSQGRRRTRTRTQVLTATVTKPKPYYRYETLLGFGSLAAPDLTFSRQAAHHEDLSEAQRERKIKKGSKQIKKKMEHALAEGKSFQDMANAEFDVLFGALDRDQEVQFRLMFTPLAQQNTVDLLTSEEGYGDDFAFLKRHKYNYIRSEHAQGWAMDTSAARYRSYDIDVCRNTFMTFNEDYFKSVYFDFAPLMAIPAYNDPPANAMKTPLGVRSLFAEQEHEALANALGAAVFRHPATDTDTILKTSLLSSDKGRDRVLVTAHSFEGRPRMDYVPTWGGDGRMHNVPVPWTEYIPLVNTTPMTVAAPGETVPVPDGATYFRGLAAYTE